MCARLKFLGLLNHVLLIILRVHIYVWAAYNCSPLYTFLHSCDTAPSPHGCRTYIAGYGNDVCVLSDPEVGPYVLVCDFEHTSFHFGLPQVCSVPVWSVSRSLHDMS